VRHRLKTCATSIFLPFPLLARGLGPAAEARAQKVIQAGAFTLTINLNNGDFSDYYETCDYTEDYIRINASYRS